MTIGAGLFLIAVGAILRFGISTSSTHGIGIHTIGDILMVVGVLGVVLWLLVFAPWARNRRAAANAPAEEVVSYRRPVAPEDEPPLERRYPAEDPYRDGYPR